jgi:hypothetical protein
MTEQPTSQTADQQDPGVNTAILQGWIDATRALARRGQARDLGTELTAITAHAGRSGIRVAVVSAAARSRSRLVNEILGRPLLPADLGADVPVLITRGGEDRLEVETDSGWSVLPAGSDVRWWQAGAPPPSAFRLQVSLDAVGSQAELGVELISVPVPADPGRPLGDARWAAIASADAIVMAMSATAAMTRSETAVLEELLRAGVSADRILILITRVDLVDEDERSELLEHVRDRARSISSGLVVLPGHADTGEPELTAAVRDWITTTAIPDARHARTRQLARQLAGCLRQIAANAEAAAHAAADEQARLADQAAIAMTARADELRGFDDIRENVRSRHNAALGRFLQLRERFGTRLSETLLHQLDGYSEPVDWWEKELPYQLRMQLPSWDQHVRLVLEELASGDVHALSAEMNSTFGVQPQWLTALNVSEPVVPEPGELPLKSLRRRRLLYRTSPTGAALLAVLAIPGIGPIAALTASLVGTGLAEVKLRGLADQQRDVIRRRLPTLLEDILNAYGDQVCAALDPIYQKQEEEIGLLREQWQAQAYEPPTSSGPGPGHWTAIKTECAELAGKILADAGAEMDATDEMDAAENAADDTETGT